MSMVKYYVAVICVYGDMMIQVRSLAATTNVYSNPRSALTTPEGHLERPKTATADKRLPALSAETVCKVQLSTKPQ